MMVFADFSSHFTKYSHVFFSWMGDHLALVVGGFLLAFLWIAFQSLAIHYFYFYKEMKKPRPEMKRIRQLETWMRLHQEQLENIYENLSQIRGELEEKSKAEMRDTLRRAATQSVNEMTSVESSFMSLGEIQLKQKLDALKSKAAH